MVQFNQSEREITLKVVYYGPALSGKTTNLQILHEKLAQNSRGRLVTLDTADDRTLFFDLLPVFFKTKRGFKIRLKLFTVPGQVMHESTRKIVLTGADGVAFIADSQVDQSDANIASWQSMIENLNKLDLIKLKTPIVIQMNKRDLPNVRTDEELKQLQANSHEPIIPAVAIKGEGVLETLYALLRLTYQNLEEKYSFEQNFGISEREFLSHIFKNVQKP